MKQKTSLLACSLLLVSTLGIISNLPSQNQLETTHVALAQQPTNDTTNLQPSSILSSPIPGWIRNDTSLWAHGKLGDAQFVLGVRYLVANNIVPLSHEYDSANLQGAIPSWVKDVAAWWTSGSVSDYEFFSDIQYLIDNGEIKLKPGTNQDIEQDSNLLSSNFPQGRIKIDNTILKVQIADTPDRMTEGLQFQQQLPYDQGMIFVFPEPQIVAMWMKDMQFPLDMIWFDDNGNVVHIEKNLPPCSDNSTCPIYDAQRQNTKYVLEVTSGFVDRFNMTENSKLVILHN